MDGDSKKSLKIAVTEFFKLNSEKGKEYTFKNLKNWRFSQCYNLPSVI